jgi:hypothetical protein
MLEVGGKSKVDERRMALESPGERSSLMSLEWNKKGVFQNL